MQISSYPLKFQIPWGNSAGAGFIRTVPVPSQIPIQDGAASFTDGFPPLNFDPVASGGVPPFGQDMNGVLNVVTTWLRIMQAGALLKYDSAFAGQIGGYPQGGAVLLNNLQKLVFSLTENHTGDPNSSLANWATMANVYNAQTWIAGGSANIQTLTLAPAPSSYTDLVGVLLTFKSNGTNTGSTTLNVNGLGAKNIVNPDSSVLYAGQLQANRYCSVVYDGTNFQIMGGRHASGSQIFTSSGSFTTPTGVTSLDVELWGGGAGSYAAYSGMWSGGGAGGGYARKQVSVTSGQIITVTIGSGGVGGATSGVSVPGSGGTTSFGGSFSATGGSINGLTNPTTNVNFGGGPGGVGVGGDLNFRGSSGTPGVSPWPGMGGAAPMGGAVGSGTAGVPGLFPGGGAAGAGFVNNDGVNPYPGANGASGLCVVRWS